MMGRYIVFLDESGDHSMENIDKNFPVFALLMLVCELGDYTRKIIPAVVEFKMEECGSEAVIIHSRDIRKATGDFGFMQNPERRMRVYTALNGLMKDMPYGIIAAVIHKIKHKEKYLYPYHPYHLSLEFLLERLLIFLRQKQNQNDVVIFAESRGKEEDNELELEFLRILNQGTNQMAASEFKTMNILLRFVKKERNVVL